MVPDWYRWIKAALAIHVHPAEMCGPGLDKSAPIWKEMILAVDGLEEQIAHARHGQEQTRQDLWRKAMGK